MFFLFYSKSNPQKTMFLDQFEKLRLSQNVMKIFKNMPKHFLHKIFTISFDTNCVKNIMCFLFRLRNKIATKNHHFSIRYNI